jgi:hypothetical protein
MTHPEDVYNSAQANLFVKEALLPGIAGQKDDSDIWMCLTNNYSVIAWNPRQDDLETRIREQRTAINSKFDAMSQGLVEHHNAAVREKVPYSIVITPGADTDGKLEKLGELYQMLLPRCSIGLYATLDVPIEKIKAAFSLQ